MPTYKCYNIVCYKNISVPQAPATAKKAATSLKKLYVNTNRQEARLDIIETYIPIELQKFNYI